MRTPLNDSAMAPARQYVERELRRLEWTESLTSEELWGWLSALSARRLNDVGTVLSDDSFTWKLEEVPLEQFVLTGVNPQVNALTIERAKGQPLALRQLARQEPTVRRLLLDEGVEPALRPDYEPLLCAESRPSETKYAGKLRVFDGMHRLLAAVLGNEMTLQAWVGRLTNEAGRPFVSPAAVRALLKLWRECPPSIDKAALAAALQQVARSYVATYANARHVLTEQVAGARQDVQEVFAPALQE
ncbi:MAG TPA: hypothetical protein VLI05_06680 [Candidatus Saccharimonadia bacterium]|nr:hypothetical protein [Candidatus Saccharimonadia bacterium]